MQINIRPRKIHELTTGLVYAGVGTVGVALSNFFPQFTNYLPPCLFRGWTGIPCPSCGATRAGIHLSHLNIASSFMANPLFSIIFLALALWGVNSVAGLFFKKNVDIVLSAKEARITRVLILAAFPLNWIFLICVYLLQ